MKRKEISKKELKTIVKAFKKLKKELDNDPEFLKEIKIKGLEYEQKYGTFPERYLYIVITV